MWLYASECLLVAIAGSIVGSAGGVLYTRMMLAGLNTIWNDAAGVTGLRLAVNPLTVLEGAFLSVLVVTLVLLITLAGTNRKRRRGSAKKIRPIHAGLPALILTLGGAGLMIAGIPGIIPASISLLSGALILGGGSLAYYAWLVRAGTDAHSGAFSTAVLVLKNLSLRKRRTMSVFILLSLGTFSIFVTEGNRKDFSGGLSDPKSGAGGFTFWAETSIPLRYDPLSPEGSSEYGLEKDRLAGSMVYCMQRLQGEDASCLNLNRALNPAILGVPSEAFSGIGAFTFISATGDKVKRDPWRALSEPCGPRVIPAVADQNVILWSLGKKTGDTLFYRDDKGERIGLRLIAGLDNSIFQGYLLISDSLFRHHFPMNGGYRNFLVKCNPDNASETEDLLNRLFGDYGIKVTKANDRLASFHAVENTYLSVFALLGALGVLLGTLGMAAVILRNMFERKGELALYHAVGYGKKRIVMVIVSEHLLILLPAILLGAISSLSGLLPELLNGTSAGSSLLIFLPSASILILANGLFWSLVAAYRTVPAIFRELKENG
jgi:hypothetical protein